MNRDAPVRGFTLIELLIVVAIIGIIVAIAAFNLINVIQRARQKKTMADMRSIATAVESYSADQNRYPPAAGFTLPPGLDLPTTTLGITVSYVSPTYLKNVPMKDGWNSWFSYGTSPNGIDFIIMSCGRDGAPDILESYGRTTNFNADIIYVDGAFVQWPEGVQQ